MKKEKKDDMAILWKETGKIETVWKGPIFEIDRVHRISPLNEEHPFVICRTPDWVTVVPERPGESGHMDFLMVRQFRHGSGELSMEFPAGVVDPGEEPLHAAIRELREETGYTAEEMIPIGRINPNPAFMANTSWTFLARGLKKTEELDLDPQEYVTDYIVSEETIDRDMGSGEYNSAIMVQAWFWYRKFIKNNPNK
jgi:ADP-ribose pyrophosphatase